jgi:hypothetical protein
MDDPDAPDDPNDPDWEPESDPDMSLASYLRRIDPDEFAGFEGRDASRAALRLRKPWGRWAKRYRMNDYYRPFGPYFQTGTNSWVEESTNARNDVYWKSQSSLTIQDYNGRLPHRELPHTWISAQDALGRKVSRKGIKREQRRDGTYYGFKYDKYGFVRGIDFGYWNKIYRRHYGNGARVFPTSIESFAYPRYPKKHALHWQYSQTIGAGGVVRYDKWKRINIGWLAVRVDEIPYAYLQAGGIVHNRPPFAGKHINKWW